jgi:hypothetical protein
LLCYDIEEMNGFGAEQYPTIWGDFKLAMRMSLGGRKGTMDQGYLCSLPEGMLCRCLIISGLL